MVGIEISVIQHLELAGSSICSTNSTMKSENDLDWESAHSESLIYEDTVIHKSIGRNVSLAFCAMIGIAENVAKFVAAQAQAGREAMEVSGQRFIKD